MNKNILIGTIVAILIIAGVIFFVSQNIGNSTSQQATTTEGKTVAGFSGKVLAGTSSPYVRYNKIDYDKAKAAGKVIFLDFYANWCPVCVAEAPEFNAGFNSLTTDKLVGFRVDWNDSETTDEDKQLARAFGITHQNTKIIVKDDKELTRTLEEWDKTTFLQQVNAALGE